MSTMHSTPQSAAAKPKVAQKRGRKGTKIINAFQNVPSTPVNALDYANKHGISLVSLQQSKRFDTTGIPGKVHVKKDKSTGTLMVWRDSSPTADSSN